MTAATLYPASKVASRMRVRVARVCACDCLKRRASVITFTTLLILPPCEIIYAHHCNAFGTAKQLMERFTVVLAFRTALGMQQSNTRPLRQVSNSAPI